MYAVTQATLLLEQNAIESADQHFILEEARRYLSHDSSGITRFTSMNKEWKDVVGKVKSGALLGKNTEEVQNTVSSWHQEQREWPWLTLPLTLPLTCARLVRSSGSVFDVAPPGKAVKRRRRAISSFIFRLPALKLLQRDRQTGNSVVF